MIAAVAARSHCKVLKGEATKDREATKDGEGTREPAGSGHPLFLRDGGIAAAAAAAAVAARSHNKVPKGEATKNGEATKDGDATKDRKNDCHIGCLPAASTTQRCASSYQE